MTTEITNQLAATRLGYAISNRLNDQADISNRESQSSDATWKDGLKIPSKDARPQTEVH